ncbi:hypothetical protein CAL29_14755 [Bordetella genomosp. 10]|uniref:Thioesterase domain-containing protein n=1 Tax=Bordetella genomosp. 10 TaxID=1416804 RepID=A0A261SD52_9BORD|nr:alpha/beta fold hydrolase [Bordetella genomosp. 10]OZI34730.1 hypothetical protein CAL29_14755 [Bordetella genomosp. 10]
MHTPLPLFCFPYAGGGTAIYRQWADGLPGAVIPIPVHLPGRGPRVQQPPVQTWPALLDVLLADLHPYMDRPLALFGHSMGALVAFELAHAMRERYGANPVWLGLSACVAPALREWEDKWLHCPRAELLDELQDLNGTHQELLRNDEFMALVEPVLRADFHLCGVYPREVGRPPLDCPILVLGGTEDKDVCDDSRKLKAWASETTGPTELVLLKGDHFFINTRRDAVLSIVSRSLTGVMHRRRPATCGV